MVRGSSKRRLSFQAKALAPVIAIMVLLVAITMSIVNRHFTDRITAEAREALRTANAVFDSSREFQRRSHRALNRQLSNEPKIKSLVRTDPATIEHALQTDLMVELNRDFQVDSLLFSDPNGDRLAIVASDRSLDLSLLEQRFQASIQQCLSEGQVSEDMIAVSGRLFDVVAAPIVVSEEIAGVILLATETGSRVAEQFKRLTSSDFVFVGESAVTTSTLGVRIPDSRLVEIYQQCLRQPDSSAPLQVELNGAHFLCVGGRFPTRTPPVSLGYVLLSSYEGPLRELRSTHELLLTVGVLGILSGSAIVWLLMRRLTRPLRELRDGAKAVGRGDFSRRVPVASNDECGELAETFNQMTANLQTSRQELERALQILRATQAQLVQSEKMSAMGQFVAGIAHELNNPLTVVIGYAELLRFSGDRKPDELDNLEQIAAGAERCRKIVRGLLSFARQHKPQRRWVSINEILESSLDLMAYELRTSNVQIVRQFENNLPKVLADYQQLEQVFVNIINNARQAIGASRRDGQIRLTTESRHRLVRIVIEDNGPGIPAEHLPKIFNPFFTTKEVGQGTGLGLSLSYGLVQEHGGTITAENRPERGARFVIELPVALGAEDNVRDLIQQQPAGPAKTNGSKTCLAIDDEAAIITLTRKMLERSGFRVQTAPDGASALQLLSASDFDIMLCDLRMPGLSGHEVFRQLHSFNARMASRFIFMTGDVVNEQTQQFLQEHGQVCLVKPFSNEQFQAAISTVLERT
jgi:signal transduction histidine kinase